MREPNDVFIKEFLQHPAWEYVFHSLEKMRSDLIFEVFVGSIKEFEERKGRAKGVEDVISRLRDMINKSKVKG